MPSIANNPDTILVQYQGSSSSIIAIAGFRFVNGILSIKAQFNFDFTTNYKITKEQYNMITIGWTYQQVTVAFGNQKGNVVSESGAQGFTSIVVQYTGIKEEGQQVDSIVTLGFSNEILVAKSQYGKS
ncbi:unnamed protein product [Rotaria sp. Silwood1]|nr:unnamed protein product [Rotaria sp. Silwood1]